jgi:hypothetical protein
MTSLESNPGKMLKMVLVAQWSHLGKNVYISFDQEQHIMMILA